MLQKIKNNSASTYVIKFLKKQYGATIYIIDSNNKVYYYRDLPYDCDTIKVNISDPGVYFLSQPAIIERRSLSINSAIYNVKMPKPERNRERDYKIIHDDKLVDSPAVIYTTRKPALIVTGRSFKKLPSPMKRFILLHEKGHMLYKTEKYCDLYAFVEFVKMGDNPSTAIYCLTDMLRDNPQNDERINYLYKKMQQSEIVRK